MWNSLAPEMLASGRYRTMVSIRELTQQMGLPTVPFLIAAAWAAGRGWPELERWLLGHPTYGIHIQRWRQGGFVPRRAKLAAISMMAVSATGLQFAPLPMAVRIAVPLVMAAVAAWLWTRPEP